MTHQVGKRKLSDTHPDILQNLHGPDHSCLDLESVCYHVALCVVQARRTSPSLGELQKTKSVSWPEILVSVGNFFFFFFLSLFIYFEREREKGESTHEAGAQRQGERILSRLCAVGTEPDTGLNLTTCETT